MKFKINNREWTIKEVSQQDLQKELNDFNGEGSYYGLTIPNIQEIWLWKNVKEEQKKKTLYHELMHCYLFSFVSFNNIGFSIDDFCDISANSHDIIHKIVEDYFKEKKKLNCYGAKISKEIVKQAGLEDKQIKVYVKGKKNNYRGELIWNYGLEQTLELD